MALHLNLYHEMQKQAMQRRRDPLKLGLYALVVVVAILLFYYFYRVEQVHVLTTQAAQLESKWKMTEPKAQEALALEAQLNASVKVKEALVQAIENRFYWAPLLEKIQRTIPANVQITSFRGSMDSVTGKGMLTVSGIAAGATPRKVAEDFRTSFVSKCLEGFNKVDSDFASLEDSDTTVQLDGKALSTVLFSLQFQFSVEEPTPSPTPVQKLQKGAR